MEFFNLFLLSFPPCLLLSLLLLRRRRFDLGKGRRLPPGSLGLPFIGETLQLISAYRTENPEPFVDDRVSRYGAVFTTHIFGEPTVFSVDPEVNRFVLQNEGRLFEASYPGSISNLLGRYSLVLMSGSLHKRMHSLTTSFVNSSAMKEYLLLDIDRLVRLNMDSWSGRILLTEETKKITFQLMVKQLMSIDPSEWTKKLMKEYMLLIDGFFTLPSPLFSPTYRKAILARKKVAGALNEVVVERRRERECRGEKRKDMLEALLEGDGGGGGGEFTDEEIVDFMVALLVAGYETTSTIMTVVVKFLTENPAALAQLKKEHEDIRLRKDEAQSLEWDDYKSMPFTQCVINETLRVANIIGGVFRRATTDVDVKGYTIPKGFKVFASFRGVHLDQDLFEDARSFDPWRWQSNEGQPTSAFMAFGGGPRRCPGYELARVELSVFLHHLITCFSWTVAEEDKLIFFPTTRMLKRCPLLIQKKKELGLHGERR